MYVCMCVYVCMYVCITCMHVCRYVCRYGCMHAWMHVCMYAWLCMYACMSACMHACMHACMFVWLRMCIYTYIYIYIYVLSSPKKYHSVLPFLTIPCCLHVHLEGRPLSFRFLARFFFPFSTSGWAETVKGRVPGPYPWTNLSGPRFLVFWLAPTSLLKYCSFPFGDCSKYL